MFRSRPARPICRLVKPMVSKRGILSNNAIFKISPEVRDAVMGGRPVVALETTIYTHGFPYPDNIALSDHLERSVRDHGAVPATIGVLNGVIRVGMSKEESKELLESSRTPTTIKLSRRDLSYICGLGLSGRILNGGTTIASTMVLSHLAGIRVFATGGLGGVHRGGENSMDISADLTELGRTPVTVISSGCKSFLDVSRTLEYLETQGACVATFSDGRGDSVDFPAFWTRESGIKSPKTILDENEAAAMIYAQTKLNLQSGMHFANPIPEEDSIDKGTMDKIINLAIEAAAQEGASGSDNTPFILDYIHRVTKGDSIKANRKLIENNVIRGAKVAVALADLEKGDEYTSSFTSILPKAPNQDDTNNTVEVFVAGSLAFDLSCDYKPISGSECNPTLYTSNPASISQSLGGVGHNIATALQYAGAGVRLCTPLGNDLAGQAARIDLEKRGLDINGVHTISNSSSTPQYIAVNDQNKGLFIAMADMQILESSSSMFDEFWAKQLKESKPSWLVIDANWSEELIQKWVAGGRAINTKIAFEPVSIEKSSRLFYKTWQDYIQDHLTVTTSSQAAQRPLYLADLVTPNRAELEAMAKHVRPEAAWVSLISAIEEPLRDILGTHIGQTHHNTAWDAIRLLSEFPCILTKLGAEGVLLTELLFDGDPRLNDPQQQPYILLHRLAIPAMQGRAQVLPPVDGQSSIASIVGVYLRHYPAAAKVKQEDIISVNGVGDTFLGVLIAASLKWPERRISELVDIAQSAAALTLRDSAAVSPKIKGLLESDI